MATLNHCVMNDDDDAIITTLVTIINENEKVSLAGWT